ncbi:hypothetical protein BT93_B1948 [Corymbia citriodora subsp. variegata]|nr:hypothetical protein BT93_B1948 [Corymbia citriodora subsp. variegata]
MSNAEDIDSTYERLDEAFPVPEADELAAPISEPPRYVTSKQLKVRPLQWIPPDSGGADEAGNEAKDEAREEERKERKGRDSMPESLSSTIVFSVAVVAVVGAIIAIAKKLRET